MIVRVLYLTCDSDLDSVCSARLPDFPSIRKKFYFSNLYSARFEGWLISRSGRCYCPACAPFFRNVGRSGKPREHVQSKLY
ncbi:hypothetical protein [Sigmofec virus UA08Rod_6120]|uniref:Uncharacterized protein n=1 Tax=Sigmofec virus UA08Rod_6120 TaxID=2929453 RepID=A0A976R786_9VIRU|nr:hypothetical protein [Sigmofec virus UA08Rod_6120]